MCLQVAASCCSCKFTHFLIANEGMAFFCCPCFFFVFSYKWIRNSCNLVHWNRISACGWSLWDEWILWSLCSIKAAESFWCAEKRNEKQKQGVGTSGELWATGQGCACNWRVVCDSWSYSAPKICLWGPHCTNFAIFLSSLSEGLFKRVFVFSNEWYFCQPLPYLLCRVEVARKELSSEVFCFISQLLLSLFSLIPGNAQEHLPDILQLLSHHSRLKGNLLSSVGSGGTSHALQRLLKVMNESAVWFFILLCVLCSRGEAFPFHLWEMGWCVFSDVLPYRKQCRSAEASWADFSTKCMQALSCL